RSHLASDLGSLSKCSPHRTDGHTMPSRRARPRQLFRTPDLRSSNSRVNRAKVFGADSLLAPANPDLKGVETRQGDYVVSQLADRMNRDDLVGDIASNWHKLARRRKTLVFCVDVAHSVHVKNEFLKSGVKAEHVDGSTPKAERDAILARLAS